MDKNPWKYPSESKHTKTYLKYIYFVLSTTNNTFTYLCT